MTRPATRLIIGSLLGGTALWLSLRDIPLAALHRALLAADPVWTVAALAATLVALTAVVLRWRILLLPVPVSRMVLLRATLVGQMLNILLPFRMGEVARIYSVTRHSTLGMTRLMTSLAVEKALDLAIFGVASASLVGAALLPRTALREDRWLVMPAVTALALAVAVVAVRWRLGLRVSQWLSGHGGRVGAKVARIIAGVFDGLEAWRSAGRAGAALAWTVAVFLLAASANACLLLAMDINVPLSASVAILVVLQAGSVPPSLPGRLGIYNYLTILTLGLYGVERAQAATYSIALYTIAYVPKLVLGAVVASDPSWRPSAKWIARE